MAAITYGTRLPLPPPPPRASAIEPRQTMNATIRTPICHRVVLTPQVRRITHPNSKPSSKAHVAAEL
jgi:hypothetical protein